MADEGGAAHWDKAYSSGETTRSWYQPEPALSLRMFAAAGVSDQDSVIDVGGGASTLVDALLARGFRDVTVLDISTAGLQAAQRRLGSQAEDVDWLTADVLTWRPPRLYQTWHDRAVFHFLTTNQDQQRYLRTLHAATAPTATAVFGCFAPDGPERCSGLPVARYDRQELAAKLGSSWIEISDTREEHITPAGVIQPFTWAVFRRQPSRADPLLSDSVTFAQPAPLGGPRPGTVHCAHPGHESVHERGSHRAVRAAAVAWIDA